MSLISVPRPQLVARLDQVKAKVDRDFLAIARIAEYQTHDSQRLGELLQIVEQ